VCANLCTSTRQQLEAKKSRSGSSYHYSTG
jgi:hypothetical protein